MNLIPHDCFTCLVFGVDKMHLSTYKQDVREGVKRVTRALIMPFNAFVINVG